MMNELLVGFVIGFSVTTVFIILVLPFTKS